MSFIIFTITSFFFNIQITISPNNCLFTFQNWETHHLQNVSILSLESVILVIWNDHLKSDLLKFQFNLQNFSPNFTYQAILTYFSSNILSECSSSSIKFLQFVQYVLTKERSYYIPVVQMPVLQSQLELNSIFKRNLFSQRHTWFSI